MIRPQSSFLSVFRPGAMHGRDATGHPFMIRFPTMVCGLACVAALLFAGCMSNVPMDISHSGRDSILPPGLELKNVRITTKLATREDVLAQMGSTFNVQSGKVYRVVFTGEETAPATLDLVSSSIGQSMGLLTASVTYNVTATLKYGDKTQVLTATGTSSTAWTIDRAARNAVEQAVIDLAKQCEVYLKSN